MLNRERVSVTRLTDYSVTYNQCKYLQYSREADGKQFNTKRAYCTAAEQFVQPMRADICNYRYNLKPEQDCEYYEDAESPDADQSNETSEQ